MVIADRNEDYILALVDEGILPFAWDLAGKDSKRRELRLLMTDFKEWVKNPTAWLARGADTRNHEEVIASLFPHSRPELRGTELQRMFSCGHSHIINLIKDGLLTATTEILTGPNGSPKITRLSIVQLLIARRVL